MMCAEPEGIMEQEAAYLAALEDAAAHQIEGDTLELRDEAGARMAAYSVAAETLTSEGNCPSRDDLGNLEYRSDFTQSGVAALKDGEYSEQAAPGSATETVVRLTEHVACGELNGQPAAAVVLVSDPGGSGTFYDLAVVVEEEGKPVNVAMTTMGDRTPVNSIAIENNEIVVDLITHGPDDPLCCPSQQAVRTWTREGDQLVETSEATGATGQGEAGELAGDPWHWVEFSNPVEGPQTIEQPEQYQATFDTDGTVAIKADCNSASGTYETEGSSITIEIGPMTLAMCGPESLSDAFVQNLGAARIYRIEGKDLYLDLFADSGTMRLSRDGSE
jgi:heat shock protein HslJ